MSIDVYALGQAPARVTVTEALARVIGEMPGIGKADQASAQQGGYRYRGIEAITAHAAPLFAKHGVVFAPRVVSWERDQISVNNKPWTDDRLLVEYDVHGPAGDKITVGPIPCVGRDNSDKGTNKALTQAFKYALIQVLCIGDRQDDGDGQTHEADAPDPAWEAHKARVKALSQRVKDQNRTDEVKALGLEWPWTADGCDQIEKLLDEIGSKAPEPDPERPF